MAHLHSKLYLFKKWLIESYFRLLCLGPPIKFDFKHFLYLNFFAISYGLKDTTDASAFFFKCYIDRKAISQTPVLQSFQKFLT